MKLVSKLEKFSNSEANKKTTLQVLASLCADASLHYWGQHIAVQNRLWSLLSSSDPQIARATILALSTIRVPRALPKLVEIVISNTDHPTRNAALLAIANQGGDCAEAVLAGIAQSASPVEIREVSIRELGRLSPWKVDAIADRLGADDNWQIAWAIAESLLPFDAKNANIYIDKLVENHETPADVLNLAATFRQRLMPA